MKTHVSSNEQYQQLLDTVGSFGKYQIRLLLINLCAFFISGAYETALFLFFDLGDPQFRGLTKKEAMQLYCNPKTRDSKYFPKGLPQTIPFQFNFECNETLITIFRCLSNAAIVCGLLVSGYLSAKYGYKRILIGNSILLLLGTCILVVNGKAALSISLILINIPQYSTCCLFLCLAVQVIKQKYVPILIIWMFTAKLFGNLAIDSINFAISQYRMLIFTVLIPLSTVFIVSHWFYHESLRFLIDHDIITGLAVLNQIAVTNNTEHQQLHIGNQFIINKIRLNRYKYKILFKMDSVKLVSYGFTVVMFALGFISQAPLYVLMDQMNRNILSLIVSAASLLGTIPPYVYYDLAKRKKALQICCGILVALFSIMTICSTHPHNVPFAVSVSIILASSTALTALISFIAISLVQSYPHTVRTLAYCLFVSFNFIGRIFCILMIASIKDALIQNIIYIEALILIILYSLFLKETKYRILQYQLKELTEREVING